MKIWGKDCAYAAGLFEGEGAVQIVRHHNGNQTAYFAVRSVIAMCDRDVLEWLQSRWGGRIYTKPQTEGHRPQWRWVLTTKNTERFLTDIAPLLVSKRVRAKVALALEFQGQKNPQGRKAAGDYNSRQQAYYERMKLLNARGAEGERLRAEAA